METKSWKDIKNDVYGEKGTERRDELEREFQGFKIGILLKAKQLGYIIELKPLLFELRTKNVWLSDGFIENALKLANEK